MRASLAVLALALIALAAWPAFVTRMDAAAAPASADAAFTPAPVTRDYLVRDALVAFYERAVRRTPDDQVMARMLAGQYLMRFRERGDVGDLKRARIAASRSLLLQPRHNDGAETELGSVALSLHDFRAAQHYYEDVTRMVPWNHDGWANLASADMELGEYAVARHVLAKSQGSRIDAGWETSLARYDELTGDLRSAQAHLTNGMQQIDSVIDNPAEARAWYHFRAGELAFEAGNASAAERDLHDALAIYPDDAKAYNTLARVYCAQHRWREALSAAEKAAELMPLPETLGYEVDARRELGDKAGADETQDLIFAIQRIGNANGINDRAIAVYESEHGIRLGDAVRIARRDLASRDDLYAEDTLAWALAMDGHFAEARAHADKAVAVGTRDSRVLFHAGWIDLRLGDEATARQLLHSALDANPQFHPYYAGWARAALHQPIASR